MTSADEEVLIAEVYPVERSFELIDNYIGELAEIALESVAEAVGDGVENRRRLATIGAVSGALAERLVDVHRNRNALQHAYPDVAAAGIYEAAAGLADDVPRFLDQYLRWFPTEP